MRRCEDVMWRWEDAKMRRWRGQERMWRCGDEKMWRWEDVKVRRCEDVMWRWEDVKMWGCKDVRMWRCEDVKMWRCKDVKVRRCEDLMRTWEDVKTWRWEDVKMWGWEDVKMWRCEDVKMFDRPPLLEEPFAQTLSGKSGRPHFCTTYIYLLRKGAQTDNSTGNGKTTTFQETTRNLGQHLRPLPFQP